MPVGSARRLPAAASGMPGVVTAWRRQIVERAGGWCCSVDAAI